ncbi:MAG: protein kinase [Rhodospirillales bacterium]
MRLAIRCRTDATGGWWSGSVPAATATPGLASSRSPTSAGYSNSRTTPRAWRRCGGKSRWAACYAKGWVPRPDLIRILDWNFEERRRLSKPPGASSATSRDGRRPRGAPASLPLDQRLDLAAQIAEALSAIHGMAVLHKDLKPANVLMRRDDAGRPAIVLTDFGSGARAGAGSPRRVRHHAPGP